ncbi:MAG TPA: ribbon-helix-helix protein, CopG family [Candidatus Sericytochromatia bacterium]
MKAITFRLPEQELEILQTYCEQEGRNQTDVLREYIRSLKKRTKANRKN